MSEMKQLLEAATASFVAAQESFNIASADTERAANVMSAMGDTPSASEILMAGTALGADTSFVIEALDAYSVTNDQSALSAACEGILEDIGNTLKGAVNRITGAVLKPLNALMKVGAGLDKLAAGAINLPFKAVTGKTLNEKYAARTVECFVAGGAILLAWYSHMPEAAVGIAKSLHAGKGSSGLFSTGTEQILTKISQFKWPFGDFSAVKSFSGGKISIKYKMLADKVKFLRADGGAGVFSKEAFKALCTFAKEAGAEIMKIAKAALIDIPKQIAKASYELAKSASMITGSGAALKAAPETTIKFGVSGSKWFERSLVAVGGTTLAIITGFIGRICITGAHAFTSAIHSLTGSKANA